MRPELLLAGIIVPAIGVIAFLLIHRKTRTQAFFYLYLCPVFLFFAACSSLAAMSNGTLNAYADPLADLMIAASGVALAGAAGSLLYAFRLAGEWID